MLYQLVALFGFGETINELVKIDITKVDQPQTVTSASLKNISSISGYQYIGKYLHVVCEDDEVSLRIFSSLRILLHLPVQKGVPCFHKVFKLKIGMKVC